jgi:hypothetical protein
VIIGGAFHFCSLLREFVIVVIVVVVIVIVVIVIVIVVIVVVVVVVVTLLIVVREFHRPCVLQEFCTVFSGCFVFARRYWPLLSRAITVTAKIYVHCLSVEVLFCVARGVRAAVRQTGAAHLGVNDAKVTATRCVRAA